MAKGERLSEDCEKSSSKRLTIDREIEGAQALFPPLHYSCKLDREIF